MLIHKLTNTPTSFLYISDFSNDDFAIPNGDYSSYDFITLRHNGMDNYLFLDGHVRAMELLSLLPSLGVEFRGYAVMFFFATTTASNLRKIFTFGH